MNIARPAFACELFAILARVVKLLAVKDDFRIHAAHGGNFAGISVFGNDDARLHAEESRCIGDRLAVIAGRSGNHSALTLFAAQLRNQIDAAAHFERADGLIIFMFDEDLCADQIVDRWIAVQRRRRKVGTNLLARQ